MTPESSADDLLRYRVVPVESYTDEQLAQMIEEDNPRWAEFSAELSRRSGERDKSDD